MAKKEPRKTKDSVTKKICSACGQENEMSSCSCSKCERTRFEPEWVLAKTPINRQTSVQVTISNPTYGNPEKRITLSKWWPGGGTTFHLNRPGLWDEIKQEIDTKLAPLLGWSSANKLIEKIQSSENPSQKSKHVGELVSSHPQVLKEIVAHINPKNLSAKDFETVSEVVGQIGDVITNANASFREAFLSIIKKLPAQPQRALEDLDLLLKGWNLNVITNVAQQVKARLETISLFEERILDPRTLEITGNNSIHRILERAMWLIDERYWLLHSNHTLRKIIGKEMAANDKAAHGKKRPDFVCGTVGERLVILELKRPSHELVVEDLNQLETYIAVAEKHFKFRSFSAYLVGNAISEDLRQRLKFRAQGFQTLFFSNLIDETKKRYHTYLKNLDGEPQI